MRACGDCYKLITIACKRTVYFISFAIFLCIANFVFLCHSCAWETTFLITVTRHPSDLMTCTTSCQWWNISLWRPRMPHGSSALPRVTWRKVSLSVYVSVMTKWALTQHVCTSLIHYKYYPSFYLLCHFGYIQTFFTFSFLPLPLSVSLFFFGGYTTQYKLFFFQRFSQMVSDFCGRSHMFSYCIFRLFTLTYLF